MTRPEQLADASAVTSITAFLGISLVEWDLWIHVIAGVVAIVAGVAAATYHIIRTIKLQNKG